MAVQICTGNRIVLILSLLLAGPAFGLLASNIKTNTASFLSPNGLRYSTALKQDSDIDPFSGSSSLNRRDWLTSGLAVSSLMLNTAPEAAMAATSKTGSQGVLSSLPGPKLSEEYYTPYVEHPEAGRSYFPALTPPFNNRATYRYDLGRDSWALEQLLTFANVTATIRCNVVRLKGTGGLWVHSPQWPTGEFCSLLDGIGGPVEHVVLPCNAFEHKAPMKAFLEKYPNAKVWIAPGQYGPLGKSIYLLELFYQPI